jgi:hypothetical protein
MTAIEKLRAIVRATEGKDELDPVHGLAVGDCADLLREFDAAPSTAQGRRSRGRPVARGFRRAEGPVL